MSEVRTDLGLPVTTFLGSTPPRAPAARLGVAVVHDLVSAIVTGEVQPGSRCRRRVC